MRVSAIAFLLGTTPLSVDAAAAAECPAGRGIYQGVAKPSHQLMFTGDDAGTLTLSGPKGRLAYKFRTTSSNGFSRDYVVLDGRNAPDSVLVYLDPDFRPPRGRGSAPFLVTPDLAVKFYYWEPFRARADYLDLLPGESWKLTGCVT